MGPTVGINGLRGLGSRVKGLGFRVFHTVHAIVRVNSPKNLSCFKCSSYSEMHILLKIVLGLKMS